MTTSPTGAACPAPEPTPETLPYWQAAREGRLTIQRCSSCHEHYFYPRTHCPRCSSSQVVWVTASGRASLYSYVISHLPAAGFSEEGPFTIAIVKLSEGPLMMTSLRGVLADPAELMLDMALRVAFEPRGDWNVPVFEPEVAL